MKIFDQSQDIALFVDKLRAYQNVAEEDFISQIVSMRQYRRYINGDSTISYVVLDKLSKKIGFDADFVIAELENEKIKQTQEVNDLYNIVMSRNVDDVRDFIIKIDNRHLIEAKNRLLFAHTKNMFDYMAEVSTEYMTINRTKKLVDLERTLTKKALTNSELLILVSFFQFESYKEIDTIAKKLADHADTNLTLVTLHNIRTVALVTDELSRYYIVNGTANQVLKYAQIGIKHSLAMKSFYLLESLFYFAAAACHRLNYFSTRDEYLTRCLSLLNAIGNKEKIIEYTQRVKDEFGFSLGK